MSDPKGFVFDAVEHNRDAIALLCDNFLLCRARHAGVRDFEADDGAFRKSRL